MEWYGEVDADADADAAVDVDVDEDVDCAGQHGPKCHSNNNKRVYGGAKANICTRYTHPHTHTHAHIHKYKWHIKQKPSSLPHSSGGFIWLKHIMRPTATSSSLLRPASRAWDHHQHHHHHYTLMFLYLLLLLLLLITKKMQKHENVAVYQIKCY